MNSQKNSDITPPGGKPSAILPPRFFSEEILVLAEAALGRGRAGSLVDDLLDARSVDERKRIVRSMLHTMGFDWLIYGTLVYDNEVPTPTSVFTTYSNSFWMQRYFAQQYQEVDSRLIDAPISGLPLVWDIDSLSKRNVPEAFADRHRRFLEDLRASGIRSGITIRLPALQANAANMIGLQSKAGDSGWLTHGVLSLAVMMALSIHEYISRHVVPGISLVAGAKISDLQRKILTGLLQGLTDKEIAAQEQLSEHAVDYHMRRLRKGFGARNRVELVNAAKLAGATPPRGV